VEPEGGQATAEAEAANRHARGRGEEAMSEVTYAKRPLYTIGNGHCWRVDVMRDGHIIDLSWHFTEAEADAWIAAGKADRQRRRVETFAERGNTTNKETA
jgi:hypothetical protein